MGGTRFADVGQTVRISRKEHEDIVLRTVEVLAKHSIEARVIPHLRSKADFGDVDLLCSRSSTHADLPDNSDELRVELERRDRAISEAIGAVTFHRGANSNPTVHFLLQGENGLVQMDVTSIPDHLLDFATAHLSWGDAGSIASVVPRHMTLKMGMNGLMLLGNTPGSLLRAPIDITHREALKLAGYDPDVHAAGFDTNEQMFEWVSKGTYFDPKIWQIEWMTNKSRRRAMKRPAYMAFLEWMDRHKVKANYDWGTSKGEKNDEWSERMRQMFPSAAAELERLRQDVEKPQGYRAFFNGDVVSQMTGLSGQSLKELMYAITKEVSKDDLAQMAENGDHDALREVILRLAA